MTRAATTEDGNVPGADRRLPALVSDVDISRPVPGFAAHDEQGRRVERVWLLVRVFDEPIGSVTVDVPDAGLSAIDVAAAVDATHGPAVRSRLAAAGAVVGSELPVDGVSVPDTPAFLLRRDEVLRGAPPITVVICTRERPGPLARCLDSLLAQVYPRFRVLVVDNAPTTDANARVAAAAAARGPVDYLVAPVPGVSHARNVAIDAAGGEILAWMDDDEVADPYWLAEVARAFADHPEADVVSGVVVPAEFETRAQVWFEQFGGLSKGRGFTPAVFSPATAHLQSPLYPLPPFGAGANMTFRPGVLESIGKFDPALVTGEDTLTFMRVLLRGGTVVYQPSALTWHYHRRDLDGLRRQLVGYGAGLTAAYTSLVLADPRVIPSLLRLVPTALHDLTADDSLRSAGLEADFPRELMSANRCGMLAGPFRYVRERLRNRSLRNRSLRNRRLRFEQGGP